MKHLHASQLAALPEIQRKKLVRSLTWDEASWILHNWPSWARPNQLPPPGEWRVWLLLAGRGFGKTRTGAELVRARAASGAVRRIAFVAPTAADARDVMVEGESGILTISPPRERPRYEPSKRRLTWPNGTIATLFSADEPERLRGPQHDLAWCDELAAWRYPEAWDMLNRWSHCVPACPIAYPKILNCCEYFGIRPHFSANRDPRCSTVSHALGATQMPLTDAKLRSLPFEDRQREYPDRDGLYVRVGRKTKTFMVTISQGGKRKRVAIGHYPVVGLGAARERARTLLAEARTQKMETLAALTLREALDRFKEIHVPKMRPGSQKQCIRILTTRFSSIEKRRLTDLKTSELAAILDSILPPAEKRNAFVWLRTFLNWCYQRGYLDQNPIARIRGMGASRQRDRVLTADELAHVWQATYEHHNDMYGALIRLLILSAQRKGQWLAFDLTFIQGDTILFPASVMKMGRAHVLPLTYGIRREIGNRATFGKWTTSYNKRALDRLSGVRGYCIHDLRRSAATHMASAPISVPPHIVERILAHAGQISGVTLTY